MNEFFFELYNEKSDRQGPGTKEATIKAFNTIPLKNEKLNILDVGCGNGTQTFYLAEIADGKITATDYYEHFLDELNLRKEGKTLRAEIETIQADMNDLPFPEKYFDIIWSEGAVYIMGFANGLEKWKRFIRDEGYLVVTEACWIKDNVPQEVNKWWESEYPEIGTIQDKLDVITEKGYLAIDYFILPEESWTDNYYKSIHKSMVSFEEKYKDNPEALSVSKMTHYEIDMYEKYKAYYSYVFFIMKKK